MKERPPSSSDPPTDLFWSVVPKFVSNSEVQFRFIRYLSKAWTNACIETQRTFKDKPPCIEARDFFVHAWVTDSLYRLYQACYSLCNHLAEGEAAKMFGQMCHKAESVPLAFSKDVAPAPEEWGFLSEAVHKTFGAVGETADSVKRKKAAEKSSSGIKASGSSLDSGNGSAPSWWRKSAPKAAPKAAQKVAREPEATSQAALPAATPAVTRADGPAAARADDNNKKHCDADDDEDDCWGSWKPTPAVRPLSDAGAQPQSQTQGSSCGVPGQPTPVVRPSSDVGAQSQSQTQGSSCGVPCQSEQESNRKSQLQVQQRQQGQQAPQRQRGRHRGGQRERERRERLRQQQLEREHKPLQGGDLPEPSERKPSTQCPPSASTDGHVGQQSGARSKRPPSEHPRNDHPRSDHPRSERRERSPLQRADGSAGGKHDSSARPMQPGCAQVAQGGHSRMPSGRPGRSRSPRAVSGGLSLAEAARCRPDLTNCSRSRSRSRGRSRTRSHSRTARRSRTARHRARHSARHKSHHKSRHKSDHKSRHRNHKHRRSRSVTKCAKRAKVDGQVHKEGAQQLAASNTNSTRFQQQGKHPNEEIKGRRTEDEKSRPRVEFQHEDKHPNQGIKARRREDEKSRPRKEPQHDDKHLNQEVKVRREDEKSRPRVEFQHEDKYPNPEVKGRDRDGEKSRPRVEFQHEDKHPNQEMKGRRREEEKSRPRVQFQHEDKHPNQEVKGRRREEEKSRPRVQFQHEDKHPNQEVKGRRREEEKSRPRVEFQHEDKHPNQMKGRRREDEKSRPRRELQNEDKHPSGEVKGRQREDEKSRSRRGIQHEDKHPNQEVKGRQREDEDSRPRSRDPPQKRRASLVPRSQARSGMVSQQPQQSTVVDVSSTSDASVPFVKEEPQEPPSRGLEGQAMAGQWATPIEGVQCKSAVLEGAVAQQSLGRARCNDSRSTGQTPAAPAVPVEPRKSVQQQEQNDGEDEWSCSDASGASVPPCRASEGHTAAIAEHSQKGAAQPSLGRARCNDSRAEDQTCGGPAARTSRLPKRSGFAEARKGAQQRQRATGIDCSSSSDASVPPVEEEPSSKDQPFKSPWTAPTQPKQAAAIHPGMSGQAVQQPQCSADDDESMSSDASVPPVGEELPSQAGKKARQRHRSSSSDASVPPFQEEWHSRTAEFHRLPPGRRTALPGTQEPRIGRSCDESRAMSQRSVSVRPAADTRTPAHPGSPSASRHGMRLAVVGGLSAQRSGGSISH